MGFLDNIIKSVQNWFSPPHQSVAKQNYQTPSRPTKTVLPASPWDSINSQLDALQNKMNTKYGQTNKDIQMVLNYNPNKSNLPGGFSESGPINYAPSSQLATNYLPQSTPTGSIGMNTGGGGSPSIAQQDPNANANTYNLYNTYMNLLKTPNPASQTPTLSSIDINPYLQQVQQIHQRLNQIGGQGGLS